MNSNSILATMEGRKMIHAGQEKIFIKIIKVTKSVMARDTGGCGEDYVCLICKLIIHYYM